MTLIIAQSAGPSLPTYLQEVMADNPVHLWGMGSASSPQVDSIAGNNASVGGANTGAVAYNQAGPTPASGSCNFGPDAFFTPGMGSMPTGSAARTFEVWYKGAWTAQQDIIGYGATTTRTSFVPCLNRSAQNNHIGVWVWANDQSFAVANLNNNAWHHIAWVYGGSNTVAVYYDGSFAGTLTYGATLNTSSSTPRIGTNWQSVGGNRIINSSLSMLAVYASALSGARIAAHYAARNR